MDNQNNKQHWENVFETILKTQLKFWDKAETNLLVFLLLLQIHFPNVVYYRNLQKAKVKIMSKFLNYG